MQLWTTEYQEWIVDLVSAIYEQDPDISNEEFAEIFISQYNKEKLYLSSELIN